MYERNYQGRILKEEKDKEKKKRNFPWRTFLYSTFFLSLIVGVVYLIRMPQLQITEVYVNGAIVADKDDVSNFVKKRLEGQYFSFIPKSSILLSDAKKLGKDVHANFPRFKNVEVKRNSLNSLLVEIQEYQSSYLWCEVEADCYFMSNDGIVFANAPYFSGDAYLKIFIGERSDFPFNPITKDQLALVSNVIKKLEVISIDITEFHFVTDYKIDLVFMHNSMITHIYFDPTLNIESSLEVLYTGLKTEPLSGMFKDSKKILEYLDLRFSDKVVYKFQQ